MTFFYLQRERRSYQIYQLSATKSAAPMDHRLAHLGAVLLFSLYFLPFHGLTLQQPLDLNSWVSLDCLEASPHPSLTAWGPQLCASQCCALCFSGNEFITLTSLCWSAFVSVPILRWKVLWELGPCGFCLLLYSQHSAWYPAQNWARKKYLLNEVMKKLREQWGFILSVEQI